MTKIMPSTMTSGEARACIAEINRNLKNTRTLLLDLYEREGWKALGYPNWRECVTAEFKQHQSYLYRQLEAARTEKNITQMAENLPIGEIPESHLRPLTPLSPLDQRKAYQKAVETAPDGKVTAKHVEETVREIQEAHESDKKKVNRLHTAREEHEIMSDEFRQAYEAMARAIINARDADWQTTDRVTAVKHIVTLLKIASGQQENGLTPLALAS
ncbi:MAG TPA: hypothetical protein VMT62_11555 [Syntrophorhabdaceae bacterium]|nr:hypothetical protein [Syntrophorhabdaceae bacterium]